MLQMETLTMSLQELQFAVSLFAFAVTIWVHDVQYYMTWRGRLLSGIFSLATSFCFLKHQ